VSGSSAATCATIGKMTLPELKRRGYPDGIAIGSLAGAGTLGLLIPPSIIMIVYGVAADVSIAQLFIAGVLPGILLALLFSGYLMCGRCATRRCRRPTRAMTLAQKLRESRHLIPVVLLIAPCWAASTAAWPPPPRPRRVGVVGALALGGCRAR
jgi:C4-dicarboxylate transporter DctM subunit